MLMANVVVHHFIIRSDGSVFLAQSRDAEGGAQNRCVILSKDFEKRYKALVRKSDKLFPFYS